MRLILPTDDKALSRAMDVLIERGSQCLRPYIAEWLVSAAFMAGARNFNRVDYEAGRVDAGLTTEHGRLRFRNEEFLRDYATEFGRLMQIDLRPVVKMKGWGLDRLRQAAIAQVVLDRLADDAEIDSLRPPFIEMLLTYGSVGLHVAVEGADAAPGSAVIEIVPPWELIPVPWNAQSPEVTECIIRQRLVSLEWIKRVAEDDTRRKINAATDTDLRVRQIDWDQMLAMMPGSIQSAGELLGPAAIFGALASAARAHVEGAVIGGAADRRDEKSRALQRFVPLYELFQRGPGGRLARYVAKVGDVVIADSGPVGPKGWKLAQLLGPGAEVWMPIAGPARYYPTGFYGVSWLRPIRPYMVESEYALRSSFQALADLDLLGYLVMPAGMGIPQGQVVASERPKRIVYARDPSTPESNDPIMQLRPVNLGTMPMQADQMISAKVSKITALSPLYAGASVGRVESGPGLSLVIQANNTAIQATSESMAQCFIRAYQALLASAAARLVAADAMRIAPLDLNVVGVAVGADGSVNLSLQDIPRPSEVSVSVLARTPPHRVQQVQELYQALGAGILTPEDFRIKVYELGLDLPVKNDIEYENWRKARMNVRLLFNDGVTPGPALPLMPSADAPEIHRRVLMAFMASPEYALASSAVKAAFEHALDELNQMLAGPPIPAPDQVVQMAMQPPAPVPPGPPPGMAGPPPG